MEDIFKDEVAPGRCLWCVINNLEKFNESPEYLVTLFEKFHKIKDHSLLSSFENVIDTIEKYYNDNNSFPDIPWLKLQYRDIRAIVEDNSPFSMQIYDSIVRYIDQEVLKQNMYEKFVDVENPEVEDLRDLSDQVNTFLARNIVIPKQTKEDIINMYDEYSANFDGIKTHIKGLDEVIGVLGYKSLSVFAAPSGHGKSTFAFSVAYYAALEGKCVDYLSFEVPKENAWFNFISIESHGTKRPLPSSLMKNSELSDEQREYYRFHSKNLLDRLERNGGRINVIDQTTTSGVNTYEDLCAKLEAEAEKRQRKADLIIVDNIDNFQTLRSKERDESVKINNYIINLDSFSKRYCNGGGTAILLLSQVNRGAMSKLHKASSESGRGNTVIDVTCVQKYNALYEKATCVLVGFADESARSSGIMRVYPTKLRNKAVPETPIQLSVDYAFSKVMGDFVAPRVSSTQEEHDNLVESICLGTADFDSNDFKNPDGIPSSVAKEIDELLAED